MALTMEQPTTMYTEDAELLTTLTGTPAWESTAHKDACASEGSTTMSEVARDEEDDDDSSLDNASQAPHENAEEMEDKVGGESLRREAVWLSSHMEEAREARRSNKATKPSWADLQDEEDEAEGRPTPQLQKVSGPTDSKNAQVGEWDQYSYMGFTPYVPTAYMVVDPCWGYGDWQGWQQSVNAWGPGQQYGASSYVCPVEAAKWQYAADTNTRQDAVARALSNARGQ